jgi:signal transduction histidine kinase
VAIFLLALAGLAGVAIHRDLAAVEDARQLSRQRAEVIGALVEAEIANLGQFGGFRRERLESVLGGLVGKGAVVHAGLLDPAGRVLVSRGDPPPGIELAGESGLEDQGDDVVLWRRVLIRERFDEAHGAAFAGTSPGGPGGTPGGTIAGPVLMVLRFPGDWVAGVRRDSRIRLAITLGLLAAVAVSALLLLALYRRSEAAERRRHLAEERARGLEGIELVAAGLAHEIKNPVGAVRGFAELLAERAEEGSSESRYARVMLESLDEVNERVNRLLWFARPRPTERREAVLDDLAADVLRLMGPDLERKQVRLEAALGAGRETAQVDPRQIKELLLNLVVNSLEAVRDGGTIRVATARVGSPASLEIAVEDDGHGIPAELLGRVCRPYFTTKARGSGLGLAICRRIVENHGGTMDIGSEPGTGTRVTVRLPG